MMAQIRGKQARVAGGYFENIISASCDYYLSRGLAKIEKTPEPMKPLGTKNRKGQFLACYTKQAQPDYPKMQEALDLIEAWGFKYKSIAFQWIKQNRSGNGYFFGLGRWTRGNTEPCLIAIKGKPKRISAGVGQLVFSPLRRHSQKPAEVRDKIVELMGDLPRIELFAREAAPGWDVWGNEAPTPEVKDAPVDSVELAGKEETHEPDNQRDPAPQL